MFLLHTNCPKAIFNVLSHMRLSLSYNTTRKFYQLATQEPISSRENWSSHTTIGMVGADNMSYFTHVNAVRISDPQSPVKALNQIDTVNFWHRYDPPSLYGNFTVDDNLFHVIHEQDQVQYLQKMLLTSNSFFNFCNHTFFQSLQLSNQHVSHLAYPVLPENTPNVAPVHIEFHVPLFNVSTSAYSDVREIIDEINQTYLGK